MFLLAQLEAQLNQQVNESFSRLIAGDGLFHGQSKHTGQFAQQILGGLEFCVGGPIGARLVDFANQVEQHRQGAG